MGLVAVLEKIDGLPGAEHECALFDRYRQRALAERRPDMGWHVVRSFARVTVISIAWCETIEGIHKIAQHVRVGVLLDQQRGGGVRDEKRQQPRVDVGRQNETAYLFGQIGETGA